MQTAILDFETYFDTEYSLRNMTTEEYLRDPRFEAQTIALRIEDRDDGDEPRTISAWGAGIRPLLESIDWDRTRLVAHNAAFDGSILSWKYGIKPRRIVCTAALARYVLGVSRSVSLASVSEQLGLGVKTMPYGLLSGVRLSDFSPELAESSTSGCTTDVNLTAEIWRLLGPKTPKHEHELIDMTTRMFTEPKIIVDGAMAADILATEEREIREYVERSGFDAGMLRSDKSFAKILTDAGICVDMKPGRRGPIPALAKTDKFMRDLADSEDPWTASAAKLRLRLKSVLYRTRAERLKAIASRGPLPVDLLYCGAHTRRWSAGGAINLQNLPREGRLRACLRAPEGKQFVIVDYSQIEARILDWMCGQSDMVAKWRDGTDIYRELAQAMFDVSDVTPEQRRLGKVVTLAAGFGMGAQRLMGTARGVVNTIDEAVGYVTAYRRSHPAVVRAWKELDKNLASLTPGGIPTDVPDTSIRLSNGLIEGPFAVALPVTVRWGVRGWEKYTRSGWRAIYGSLLLENVVQAAARNVFARGVFGVWATLGMRPVLMAHDEGVWLEDAAYAGDALREIISIMTFPFSDAREKQLPLQATGRCSDTYG